MKKYIRYIMLLVVIMSLLPLAACRQVKEMEKEHKEKDEVRQELQSFEDACNKRDVKDIIGHIDPEKSQPLLKGMDVLEFLGADKWIASLFPGIDSELDLSEEELEEIEKSGLTMKIKPGNIELLDTDPETAEAECEVVFTSKKTEVKKNGIFSYKKDGEKWYITDLQFTDVK